MPNEFYYFDEYVYFEEYTEIDSPSIYFNDAIIHYSVQSNNRENTLEINREADLIFKKGDYLHTYITVDLTGFPDNITFDLLDEHNNQLYSPFTPDREYEKYKCTIGINGIYAIPLPADYIDNKTWIDFEPGVYNWKLKSEPTEYYDSLTINLRVEIRSFSTWEPYRNYICPNEPVIYEIRTYADTTPLSTNLLTTNATYENGYITYPPSDIDTTIGEHTQVIGNRIIYYVIKGCD